jgi:aminopeptidase N
MLQEIQKTGDIFFPNAWLNATLGGHSSPEAAAIVRRFLATLPPDYPERLKNITLQSADGLFRATLIQERQGRDDSSPAILGAGAAAPF